MPQSLASIYLHLVFSTKNRHPFLHDPILRSEMHAYVAEVTKRLDCPAIEIGGVQDHVHALVRFGRTITVANWVKETKRVSSIFCKQSVVAFAWQAGYGVFSVSAERLDSVASYIRSQEEHHRTLTFQDEFRQLLLENGLEWDERFVWD